MRESLGTNERPAITELQQILRSWVNGERKKIKKEDLEKLLRENPEFAHSFLVAVTRRIEELNGNNGKNVISLETSRLYGGHKETIEEASKKITERIKALNKLVPLLELVEKYCK